MKGDFSRWTVDPGRHFGAVLMQQGRVHTDADWNEWVALTLRRARADSLDTLHPAFVSDETPDAFLIAAAAGRLGIGPGRMYVDGLLAENMGGDPVVWDPRMEELRGQGQIDYTAQPFYPNPPALPAGGVHLVYLKVWQRDVTAVEDPRIVEPALGVDTTTRLQTAWQVKVLPDAGDTVTIACDTEIETLPGFAAAEPAAAGRLTTGTADVDGDPDPCRVPVGGAYKGLENQLYRVEIHTGGDLSAATFTWSRDNATVASRVSHIPALDRIVVESVGRDAELRFHDGDWIEITDDWRELNGLPGEMRRIAGPGGVDDATRTILLDSPLPAGMFPVDAQDRTAPERNTRARRWDQAGRVLKADGTLHVDLDAAGATGTVPVVTGATSVLLEHGIVVSFDLDPAGGAFRPGDHWLFAARAVDASVEILDGAPPRGVHAHYAKLATVTLPDTETDLRECPPPPAPEGDGCECDACVTVEDHESGARTVQDAVDAVIAAGGGTICLGIGTYVLDQPIRIHDARSVRLRGKGWHTLLLAAQGGSVIDVQAAVGVTVQDLAVVTASPDTPASAITLRRCVATTIQDCAVLNVTGQNTDNVAIEMEGFQVGTAVRRCALAASTGIAGGARDESAAMTASLQVRDNWLLCQRRGVELERFTLLLADTHITGNLVLGCRDAGLVVLGGSAADAALDIADNLCQVEGDGIVVGVDAASVTGNDVRGQRMQTGRDGIVLAPGLQRRGIEHLQVLGNRIPGVRGHGIAIRTRVESGMIKHNVIAETGGGGIVMESGGQAGTLVVENNQLLRVTGALRRGKDHAGMLLFGVDRLAVAGNVVDEFAREVPESTLRSAIVVMASEGARLDGNHVGGVAPVLEYSGLSTGLHVVPPFGFVDATGNRVRRRRDEAEKLGTGPWIGILVGFGDEKVARGFFAVGDVAVASTGQRAFAMTSTHVRALARGRAGDLAVRGNTVESEASPVPPVLVADATGVRFSDNMVVREGSEPHRPSFLRCVRAVVSANDLRDRLEDEVLRVETTGQGTAAIIGNLVAGPILLNGNQVPMDVLNPYSGA